MRINKDKFLLSFLSVESIGISFAQTTPLIYLFSALFFPAYVRKIAITPIFRLLLLFLVLSILVSGAWFFAEVLSDDPRIISTRIAAFARQLGSLVLGLLLFVVLRNIFLRTDREIVLRFAIYSIIPIMLFSIFVDVPRYLQNPAYRLKSYFTEPSHLCEFLVQVVFASVYVYWRLGYKRLTKHQLLLAVFAGLALMVLTFSGTGFLRLLLLVVGVMLFEPGRKIRLIFLAVCAVLGATLAVILLNLEDNYLVGMLYTLPDQADETASFIDRYYSFIGPLQSFFKSLVAIGYGLGGDAIYYRSFYPAEFVDIVEMSKREGFGIVSFWGKILVFTGIPGIMIWILIIRSVAGVVKRRRFLFCVLPVFFSIFLHGLIGSGAFLLVHTWFWLAFIDSFNLEAENLSPVIVEPETTIK